MWRFGDGKMMSQYEAGPGLHTGKGLVMLIWILNIMIDSNKAGQKKRKPTTRI